MTLRTILTPPEPALRTRASRVRSFDSGLQALIDDMIETMRDAPGVGLAAPQLGESKRVIVVEYREEKADDPEKPATPAKLYVVVNPEITRRSQETVAASEACLSLPGYAGEVERYETVTVKGFNRRGQPIRVKADGWLARIFQHEIDHLEGVLFIDRATRVWKVEEQEGEAVAAAD